MISKAAKKAEKQDNLQTVDKPIQFKNRVWGVAPSGVRAAAPHSAPFQGKGFGDRD